jgi:hypothetical protein
VTWPFGRYKGEPVEAAPTSYLAWVWEHVDLRPPLEDVIREELAERLDLYPEPTPARLPEALRPAVRAVVRAGFRQLALDRHPDHGGSDREMRDVLAAREWLEGLVS